MAETLPVTDMLPNKFEPKRKFRWVFAIEGIDSFLMKTSARPTISSPPPPVPLAADKARLDRHLPLWLETAKTTRWKIRCAQDRIRVDGS